MNFLVIKSVAFDYLSKKHEHKKISISSNLDFYMRILISALFFLSSFFISPFGKLNAGSWLQIGQQNSFWCQKPSHIFWFRKLNSMEKFAKTNRFSSAFVPREEIAHLKKAFLQPLSGHACSKLKQKCIQKLLALKSGESIYFEFEDASHENFSIKLNVRPMQTPYPVNNDGMIDEDGHFTCQICADFGCGNLAPNCPINKLPMLPAIEIYAEKELSHWIKNMITSCMATQSWFRLHKKGAGALALAGFFVGHELFTGFNVIRRIKQIKPQRERNARLKQIESDFKESGSLLVQTINGEKYPWLSLTVNTAQEIKEKLNSSEKHIIVSALDLPFYYNAADLQKHFPLFAKLFPKDTKSSFGSPDKAKKSQKNVQSRVLVIPLSVICRLTYHGSFELMLHKPNASTVDSFVEKLNEFGWKLLIIPDFPQEDDCEIMTCTSEHETPDAISKPTSSVECLCSFHFPKDNSQQPNKNLRLHWVLYPTGRDFYRSSEAEGGYTNVSDQKLQKSNLTKRGNVILTALGNC